MKRKKLIVANWKMNPLTLSEASRIFVATRKVSQKIRNAEILLCPPSVYLSPLLKLRSPKNLSIGSQNLAIAEKGAFTGEVSGLMLKNLGVKMVLVGHSERRAMGETDEVVRRKLDAAWNAGLLPILCLGESKRDKEGAYLEFLTSQIKVSLFGLSKKNLVGLIIAYEPIWAIGKSAAEAMSPTDIHETALFIKKTAGEIVGKDIADSFRILYGGSVESGNVENIVRYGNIDGFLVGHASLDPVQFPVIVKATEK